MTDEIKVVSGLYYTKEHEWAKPQEDGTVLVGIDDYAQEQLHEIVYVELPKEESDVVQGQSIGAVESVKAVSDMFSPVSGQIIEVNQDFLSNA